jgi:hypothetical protein
MNDQYYEYIHQDINGKIINYGKGIQNRTKVLKKAKSEGGNAYCKRVTVEYFHIDMED